MYGKESHMIPEADLLTYREAFSLAFASFSLGFALSGLMWQQLVFMARRQRDEAMGLYKPQKLYGVGEASHG